MMKQTVLVLSLFILLFNTTGKSQGQEKIIPQTRTVLDYFLMLPSRYAEPGSDVPLSKKERVEMLKQSGILDIPNGYLRIQGECACAGNLTACLFKRNDGSYLMAVQYTGGDIERPFLRFFEYQHGRLLRLVTSPLPVRIESAYKYELPRIGTTIRVKNDKGKNLYSLYWNRSKFELMQDRKLALK